MHTYYTSFLLGLRWQLTQQEWGFTKKEVKVQDETLILKVGNVPVVGASVREDKLHLQWMDPAWQSWKELHASSELAALIAVANKKLQASAEWRAKGKGEGKAPQ